MILSEVQVYGPRKKDGKSTGPISPIADSSPIRLKTSLLGEDAQDGSSAVSYTHLDVYKRQIQYNSY